MTRMMLLMVALATGCAGGSGPTPEAAVPEVTTTTVTPPAVDPVGELLIPGPPEVANPKDGPSGTTADGGSCLTAADCQSGVCEGVGCEDEAPGLCAPAGRACTRDLRPYCGCDGQTFRTSGSCPGRRYAAKGPCEGDVSPL